MERRYLFKLEYGQEKFCTFFINLDKKGYNFINLTNDIKANVRSLQHVTPTTIRIRFRDEDGDYINLGYGDEEIFNEMFKTGQPVHGRDYKKIYLKVSQLDSPVQVPCSQDTARDRGRRIAEPEVEPFYRNEYGTGHELSRRMPAPNKTPCSLNNMFSDVADDELEDDEPYLDEADQAFQLAKTTTDSPLERYVSKLNDDKANQERKVAALKEKVRIIDDKLLQAKSSQFTEGTVCGNCHLRLGHTARRCTLEKCNQVFACGIEKLHPKEINRTKMQHEIKREESILKKINQEINTRESAIKSLKKSLASQVEQKLLTENKSDYMVGGLQNWTMLRRHVHLIESYCKRNFNGKIPPKQNLSGILRLAVLDDEERGREGFSHSKRRRVHENPAKSVLESYGVNFPTPSNSKSTVSSPHSTSHSSEGDLLYRCEPKSREEEKAQLELVLQASACNTIVHPNIEIKDSPKHFSKTEVDEFTIETIPTTEQNALPLEAGENAGENNAVIALMSLFNSTNSDYN